MKKLLLFLTIVIFLAFLTSCSEDTTSEERFSEYINLWNQQDFAQMYQYLSLGAKQSITEDEFVKRYTNIYKDLEVHKLSVKLSDKQPQQTKGDKQKLKFSVKMETLAGPIQFEQTATLTKQKQTATDNKEKQSKKDKKSNTALSTETAASSKTPTKETWYIDWSNALIFPELSKKDKITVETIPPTRGEIYDRYGDPLALNGTAHEIGIIPKEMTATTVKQLAKTLKISEDRIEKALSAQWVKPEYFVPITKIAERETALLAKLYKIPGVTKKNAEARIYPFGEAAAHLIGYTGPITAAELKTLETEGYTPTDTIGKRGLEQILDKKLKGQPGAKIIIKKHDGTSEILAEKKVKHGETITLTIDATLQQQIFNELKGEAGAATAIDPLTGETLALVSSPSFDPNKLAVGINTAELKALEQDPQMPLLNRFKSTYVPGSVMKPITASIGLKAGTLTPSTAIDFKGLTWTNGNFSITRVIDPGTSVDLEKALLYSDNIYFAQAALKLGKNNFTTGLKEFGFDTKLPYLYPLEKSPIGKLNSERQIADTGYGQGQIEMSVVHLAAAYTPLLNGGNMIKPTLTIDEKKGQIMRKKLITSEQAATISQALEKVVDSPRGSAHSGKIDGMPLAGKTGTAELKTHLDEEGAQLGWFVAYKTEAPHLLIAIMIENAQKRGGSRIAVEKVKNVLTQTANPDHQLATNNHNGSVEDGW